MAIITSCQLDLNVQCKKKSACYNQRADLGLSSGLTCMEHSIAGLGVEDEMRSLWRLFPTPSLTTLPWHSVKLDWAKPRETQLARVCLILSKVDG